MSSLTEEQKKSVVFERYNSPIAQWHLWGMPQPYGWQMALLDACWRPGAMVSARTCNESGKTDLLIPLLAMSWASAFVGSQVVITSSSEEQIKLQLWPRIQTMARMRGWAANSRQVKLPSMDENIPGSTVTIRVTKQGERFEGFHNRLYIDKDGHQIFSPLLMIADEAKSINHDIFFAITRCDPLVRLYISTCGADHGDFYDSCHDTSGLWTTSWKWAGEDVDFKIPWTMCPHLMGGHSYEVRKALIDEKGPNDPDVASMLLAEFFRAGSWMVFEDIDLLSCKRCMSGIVPKMGTEKRAFCDFSHGGDELTFGMRTGNVFHPIIAWNYDGNVGARDIAERYARLFREHALRPEEISGDNGGSGALIISELESLGWPINRINANRKPLDETSFADRYAELHWNFKSLLQKDSIKLPKDEILLTQMRVRQFMRNNSDENKIRMEPKQKARKERKEKSPDRLDTIVGLCEDIEEFSIPSGRAAPAGRTGAKQEWWKSYNPNKSVDSEDRSTMMTPW